MHPADVNIGDLVKTYHGLARVMKFFAPAFIACVLLEGKEQGTWVYLRGYDLDKAELIK
jgi:hypothetical protein